MKRGTSRCLSQASMILLAAVLLGHVSVAQGIHEVEVDAGRLDWQQVSPLGAAFAVFEYNQSPYFALSDDGGRSTQTTRLQKPGIRLRYKTFDPLLGEPKVPLSLQAKENSRLFLVQYETQVLPEYKRTLREMGADVLQLFPWQANLVRIDVTVATQIRGLNFVRWIGPYHPAYRIDAVSLEEMLTNTLATKRFQIHVTKKGMEEKAQLAAFISSINGQVHDYISPFGFLIDAVLSPSQLRAVLDRDDVLFVDPWSAPETDLDIARQLGGADAVEAFEGYAGQGVRGQVQDGGLFVGHPDYQAIVPIIHTGNSGSPGHGTSVYGIVFGTGMNNAQARGFLPQAQPVFASYVDQVDRYIETGELLQDPLRCVFETNSWGSSRTFNYTTTSANMDNILFDHDIVVLQSQSNAGNQDSRPQAWAKNIISVGGIRHFNTLATSDDSWTGSASIGPAADGRIKPDISAFYDFTLSANSSGGYSNFGGTSGATPITAGHIGLIHQMWADGIFGNSLTSWDVFANKPHATTAKALLLNSATQYPFNGLNDDLTRVHQGWGRPDINRLYTTRNRMRWIDQTVLLTPLATNTTTYVVQAGEAKFRATMIFSDPPGNPAAAVHRINDLTLKVTDPMGTIYWGNNGLLANNFSASGGVSNTIDTVEQVLINNPISGTWIVEVIASEINQDGHTESLALDADFSLVVSGVDPQPSPAPDSGQANQVGGSLQIVDAVNLNGQKPKLGVPGPFFANLPVSGTLSFIVEGPANLPYQLLLGPLGRGNESFGAIGNLDVGLVGPGVYTDIQVVLNGLNPISFFDLSANTGPTGRKVLSVSLPPFVLGTIGTFQAVVYDPNPANIRLTAATEVTVN